MLPFRNLIRKNKEGRKGRKKKKRLLSPSSYQSSSQNPNRSTSQKSSSPLAVIRAYTIHPSVHQFPSLSLSIYRTHPTTPVQSLPIPPETITYRAYPSRHVSHVFLQDTSSLLYPSIYLSIYPKPSPPAQQQSPLPHNSLLHETYILSQIPRTSELK